LIVQMQSLCEHSILLARFALVLSKDPTMTMSQSDRVLQAIADFRRDLAQAAPSDIDCRRLELEVQERLPGPGTGVDD